MASAFDSLDPFDANFIRQMFMAGASMAAIRREFSNSISAQRMRELRDELFEPLLSDPEKVKELAAGPCINPLVLNRPKQTLDRHARMARKASRPVQTEMFPA